MVDSVNEYLEILREELTGSDPATLQDALSDAEEHLRTALENEIGGSPGMPVAEALQPIIDKYGSPQEVAEAYLQMEVLTRPALAQRRTTGEGPFIHRYLAVLTDARAWGALLYLLFSSITGIVYFTWAITGLSLSLGLMVLVIGLPFAALFLLSVRSIAFVEGRIVEALLGIRMPRRTLCTQTEKSWLDQIKSLFLEDRTWTTITYMILQLPLGVFYFSVITVLIATSLAFLANPILELAFEEPVIRLGAIGYHTPIWLMPILVVVGFMLLLATMQFAKFLGRQHGVLAKVLLVGRGVHKTSHSEQVKTRDGKEGEFDRSIQRTTEETMDVNDKSQGAIEGKAQIVAVIVSVVLMLAVFGMLILSFVLSS
jgi:uncharacterized membrane protein